MEETRKQPSRLEVIGAVISLGVLVPKVAPTPNQNLRGLTIWKNLLADNKMAEENKVEPKQVTTEPQQVTKEPQ